MSQKNQMYRIKEIHPTDEWYGLKEHLIGQEIDIKYSDESQADKEYLFVIGEMKKTVCGSRIKTFLAVKLQEVNSRVMAEVADLEDIC